MDIPRPNTPRPDMARSATPSTTVTGTPNASSACLRREDEPLLRGQGQFVHHFTAPGLLHVIFLRSDKAQGQIQIQGLEQARTLPGVRAILTATELGHCHMPAINPLLPITPAVSEQLKSSILAKDHVTHVGQPIGLIVADSLEDGHQALALIEVTYQEPPQNITDTLNTADSLDEPNTPVTQIEIGAAPPTASAQDAAHAISDLNPPRLHHVQTQLKSPRVISAALEPRAVVAHWDDTAKTLEVRMGTQSPSRARSDIAAATGLTEDQVRVISKDVGGAFGAKASVYPEDLAIARAAVQLRASLKWTSTRMQEFASAMHGRGSEMTGRLAVNEEGRFTFLGAQLTFDLGAWVAFSGVVPLRNAARILPGPYCLKNLHVQGQAFLSGRAPVNIYRGAGRPEAALLMETLVDAAARKLGMDPVELRHLNLVREEQMPWQTPSGETLDSGNYPKLLEMACEAFGYQEQRSLQASRRAAGECVGIGVAFYVEPCGQGWESARVTLHTNGHVSVSSGSPAQGQGHLTSFARIAAQALGCPMEKVTVVVGDTDQCPPGIGTLASRSTAIGGSAIVKACREVLERQKAGHPLPLTAECRFESNEAWSAGCVIARVSIDIDTGEPCVEKMTWADDAGNIIDPVLAHGQLIGGAAQGLGQALMEAIHYDSSGQLLTGSFMDYAIPRATDMPEIDVVSQVTPSPNNPLGAKGVGEAGCIGVPAAIMNAVRDALSEVSKPGEVELSFPLTAEQIWHALNRETPEPQTQQTHHTAGHTP